MRIALVSEHASPLAVLGGVDAGGQNVHVAELAAGLTRLGHAVTVYTRRDDPDLPALVRTTAGYRVIHVSAGPPEAVPKDDLWPFMPAFAAALTREWTRRRPDVVHAHFWMSGWAASSAAHGLGVPVVMTFHALGAVKRRLQRSADTSPPRRLAVERQLAQTADLIVATCSDEVRELRAIGADPDRVTVVPCGVDVDHFHPGADLSADRPGPYRLVGVGRLVARKGFDDVITAVAQLRSLHRLDVELVVAGGQPGDQAAGTEFRRLRELAARLGVADAVRLAGQVSRARLPGLLRSADVVVCAPWYEPFGIVPLEAMGCARPVVATAVGGFLDTVVDGVTGELVPPRDPAALAEAVAELLRHPERRHAYGLAGRARVEARYSWTTVAADTLRAYASLRPSAPTCAGSPATVASSVTVHSPTPGSVSSGLAGSSGLTGAPGSTGPAGLVTAVQRASDHRSLR